MAISKRKLIYPIFATLVLLGLAVIMVFYVQFKNLDTLRDLIAEEIHTGTQRDVRIGSAQLDFTEGVGVQLGALTLKGSSAQQSDFTCEKVLVLLHWLPLLEGKIEIQKLIFEGLMVQVTRDDQGAFNIGNLSANLGDGSAVEADNFNATLSGLIRAALMHSVSVRNSELWLVDHSISSGSEPLVTKINNLSFSLNKHHMQSSLRVHLDGDVPFSTQENGRIKLDGKMRVPQDLSNLSQVVLEGALQFRDVGTEPFQPYLAKVFEQHPGKHLVTLDTRFAGTLDGHIQLSGTLSHTPTPPPSLNAVSSSVQGSLDFNVIFNRDTVEFKQLDYRVENFFLQVKGTFARFLSDKAKLTATLKSAPFPVERSADYLPMKVFSREIHNRLHRFIEKGDVEIASLNIEGPRSIFEGRSNAEIEAYDSGSIILHGVNLGADAFSLKGVTGGLQFKDGVVSVNIQGAQYKHVAIKNLVGTVTRPFTEPWVTGTLEAEGALAPLALLIEKEWTLPQRLTFLKEIKKIQGTSHGKLLVQGPIRDMKKLKWSGQVSVDRAEFTRRGWNSPVRNINGNIYFRSVATAGSAGRTDKDWVLEFKRFKGEFGNHYFTDTEAEAFTKNGVPVKKVRGKIKLGVLKAEQLIAAASDDRIKSFLKHVVFEAGEIGFKIQNTGPKPGEKQSQNRGSLEIRKLFIKHSGGYRPLKNLNATVSFDDNTVNLKAAKGWYGDSPLELQGRLKNYSASDPELALTAQSVGFLRQDFSGIPFLETLEYQGPAKVDLRFHYTDQLMKLEKVVDLTQASYRYQNFLIKPENVSNSIKISATLDPAGKVDFKKVVFELEGSQVTGKGFLKSMNDPQFSILLGSDQFKTWPASQYIRPLQGSLGGHAHFHVSAQGNFKDLEKVVLQGDVRLKGIEYKPDSLRVPIKFNADMKFKNNHFQIRNGKLEAKGSKVFFKGDYQGGEAPHVKLKLVGPGMDLNQMVAEEGKPSKGFLVWLGGTRVFSKGAGEIEIKIDQFTHKHWTLPEVAGKFTFKDQVLRTRSLTLGKPKVDQIKIKGNLSLADIKNPSFDTLLVSRGVPIEKLFAMFGGMFQASLTGKTVWLKAHLLGQGGDLKQITQSLKGRVSFKLKDGRINTGRLLNGAVELFGISVDPATIAERERQHNKGYLQIFGDFPVVNGVARTENFLYEEKGQRMSLVGSFDLNASRMDTVVGVAPFRRVGRVIEKIPIIGHIVTGGKEGSLITTYYKVEGFFSDPKVEAVPFKSVSGKVLSTLEAIVTAPSDLFTSQEPSTE